AAEGPLDETDARVIERAIDEAVVTATAAGGGGLVQLAPLVQHGAAVLAGAPHQPEDLRPAQGRSLPQGLRAVDARAHGLGRDLAPDRAGGPHPEGLPPGVCARRRGRGA